MKCIFRHDLIFREVQTVKEEEGILDSDLCDTDALYIVHPPLKTPFAHHFLLQLKCFLQ